MTRTIAFAAFLIPLCLHAQPAKENRLAVPADAEKSKAIKEVTEVFKAELAAAKGAARGDIAKKMLDSAKDDKEPAATRWALFDLAQQNAIAAADAALTLQVVGEKAKAFDIVATAAKAEAVDKIAKPANVKAMLDALTETVEEAIGADDYKSAARLLATAQRTATAGKETAHLKQIEAHAKRADSLGKQFEAVKLNDAAFVRFVCMGKGDWARGLPLLAKTENGDLSALAERDLKKPTDGKERIALGDAWFDLADKAKGDEKLNLLRRAHHWYRLCAGSQTGLSKAKVDQRIEKAAVVIEAQDALLGAFSLYEGVWSLKYSNGNVREYEIDSRGRIKYDAENLRGQLTRVKDKVHLSFNDGKLELVRRSPSGILIEHFRASELANPKRDSITAVGTFQRYP